MEHLSVDGLLPEEMGELGDVDNFVQNQQRDDGEKQLANSVLLDHAVLDGSAKFHVPLPALFNVSLERFLAGEIGAGRRVVSRIVARRLLEDQF